MDDSDKKPDGEKSKGDLSGKAPHSHAAKPTRITITDNSDEPEPEKPDKNTPSDEHEVIVIDAEKEPETSGIKVTKSASHDSTVVATPAVHHKRNAATVKTSKKANKMRLKLTAIAGIVLTLVAGILGWWFLAGSKENVVDNVKEEVSSAPIAQPILGITVTVADGTVEYLREGSEWQPLDTATILKEGDTVRTGTDGRAVLTVEDGTVVRLDDMTGIKIMSLAANKIEITQLDGTLYSRVVPSDRKYSVEVDGSTYEALGTAFATFRTPEKSGVRVFQSAVLASDISDGTITEGREFFRPFGDFVGTLEVAAINIDAIADDEFIQWNITEDEKDNRFKEKLGVLPRIKQRSEEMKKQRINDQIAKAEAERAAATKAAEVAQAKEKQQMSISNARSSREAMVLSLDRNGRKLHWTYTGDAQHGYKLVYSRTNETPILEKDAAVYFSSMDETSGTLPSRDKIGDGKFYVRVCAYAPDNKSDPCLDYSNIVIVNL